MARFRENVEKSTDLVNTTSLGTKMNYLSPKIVICGTDTDVGKTIVSSFLVQGLNASYWKPIQSGLENNGDKGTVSKLLSLPNERLIPETYKFEAAVSPHWAAEKENRMVNPSELKLPITQRTLIIETAGGLMVPLNRAFLQIQQLKAWKLPVILVARTGLGTLNHTLLSIEALKNRSIPLMGLILNGHKHEDNPRTLEEFSGVCVIAQLPRFDKVSAKQLSEEWEKQKLGAVFQKLMRQYC